MRKYSISPEGSNSRVELYRGDCVAGMRSEVAERSVDVVVTSPPYNIGVRYSAYDDRQPRASYLAWIDDWAAAVGRVLAEDGSIFLNVGSKPSDPWVAFDVASVLRKHFKLQNVIHWIKSIAIDRDAVGKGNRVDDDLSFGHYKPINSRAYLNDVHEYIFHFTRSGKVAIDRLALGVPYQDKSNVKRWKSAGKDRRCRGNAWFIPYQTIQRRAKERPHPATFPPRLAEMCVLLHGLERAGLVLDPFMGLGSTALACVALGRNCVGFEVDPQYCELAARRIRDAAQQPREATLWEDVQEHGEVC